MTLASLDGAMLAPRPNWALFLDIDGTLLDIAAEPRAVKVPKDLAAGLARASRYLGGALALASGRGLAEIDQLMAPLRPPCLAEHGAVLRYADGSTAVAGPACAVPDRWRMELRAAVRGWRGVQVEEKAFGVAVHYRLAPEREAEVRDLVEAAVAQDRAGFEVLPARMAFEIRHRGLSKAAAVEQLMPRPPFVGRIPVFVGDDVTDEDGFRVVNRIGGHSIKVGEGTSAARWRLSDPAAARAWLAGWADAYSR